MVNDCPRTWWQGPHSLMALEERYEIIRDIGDGSFGSVALARVRGPAAQSNVARRGTLVHSSSRLPKHCLLTLPPGCRQDHEENV